MFNQENRGTILYVEDNPDNRLLVRRILASEGFIVNEAESATKALEILKNLQHLIFMLHDLDTH